jgi:hypothetical protein
LVPFPTSVLFALLKFPIFVNNIPKLLNSFTISISLLLYVNWPKQCTTFWKVENSTIFLYHVNLNYLIKW